MYFAVNLNHSIPVRPAHSEGYGAVVVDPPLHVGEVHRAPLLEILLHLLGATPDRDAFGEEATPSK